MVRDRKSDEFSNFNVIEFLYRFYSLLISRVVCEIMRGSFIATSQSWWNGRMVSETVAACVRYSLPAKTLRLVWMTTHIG